MTKIYPTDCKNQLYIFCILCVTRVGIIHFLCLSEIKLIVNRSVSFNNFLTIIVVCKRLVAHEAKIGDGSKEIFLKKQNYLGYFSPDNGGGWVPEINFGPFSKSTPNFCPRIFQKRRMFNTFSSVNFRGEGEHGVFRQCSSGNYLIGQNLVKNK